MPRATSAVGAIPAIRSLCARVPASRTFLEKMADDARSGMVIYRSRLHWWLKRNFQLMPCAEWLDLPWAQKVASPLNGDAVPP